MKQILRDNALESWAMAVKLADEILDGKATFLNKKYFVSSLQNAIELFIKQYMLNQNDYRVAKLKNPCESDGEPLREYLGSNDLNSYFKGLVLDSEKMGKFRTADFNDIKQWQKKLFSTYYTKKSNAHITKELDLLQKLRNAETHFYIDASNFLLDNEFKQLHNMMIRFYDIIKEYRLLPFWGETPKKYRSLDFNRIPINNFSYEKCLMKSDFVKKLKINIENNIFPLGNGDDAYSISENIVSYCECFQNDFDEVCAYVQMLLKYKRLSILEKSESEIIDGQIITGNSYSEYKII